MTQAALAEALGVGKRSVGRWERGESVPRYAIPALIELLGIPTVEDRQRRPNDDPLTDDTIAAALEQASHLQVLAELARRIQAAHEPERELPPVPQVHLQWPMQDSPTNSSLDSVNDTPEQSIEGDHSG